MQYFLTAILFPILAIKGWTKYMFGYEPLNIRRLTKIIIFGLAIALALAISLNLMLLSY